MEDFIRRALTDLLPRLRRFAVALTGSLVDADELVQGACERALQRSDQLREHARMDAWLYGIMRNLWIDELRHRRIRRHDTLDQAGDIVGDDGQAVVDGRIDLATVRRSLSAMPQEQRTVLILVCVDGLSYKEAAEALGVPVGTVMSRLSRARLDLHQRLAGHAAGDPVVPFRERSRRPAASSGGEAV